MVAGQPLAGLRQRLHDFVAVQDATTVFPQSRVFGQCVQTEQFAQGFPMLIGAGDVHETAVGTAETGRGHTARVFGAHARRQLGMGKEARRGQ
ncbi:hypothetical protein D3C87_1833550 [compost metagenome]